MSCPDTDRLIDSVQGPNPDREPDPELEAHLRSCASCREDAAIIQGLHDAFRPQVEVPEELIQRVMDSLPEPDAGPEARRPHSGRPIPIPQALVTGILGVITAGAAILASGTVGAAPPLPSLLFAATVGAASVAVHLRLGAEASSTPS